MGSTSDYVKATFVNGKIVSLESHDALSTNLNSTALQTADSIQNKMHSKKVQTEKVVYVAPTAERAAEMAEMFKNDSRVRVIHPGSGFDNQRVYKAPVTPAPVTSTSKGGKVISRSLSGPRVRGGPFVFLTVLQSPLYVRSYGWKDGAIEMALDTVDPLGFRNYQVSPDLGPA
ncbi:hypothetical protein ACFW96_20255 [Streptomyces gardneri]|uniref:hypothetical protein n=1 Tax=Streptomyces gardneri TaxID=66892 RepID=UPI0036D1B697